MEILFITLTELRMFGQGLAGHQYVFSGGAIVSISILTLACLTNVKVNKMLAFPATVAGGIIACLWAPEAGFVIADLTPLPIWGVVVLTALTIKVVQKDTTRQQKTRYKTRR